MALEKSPILQKSPGWKVKSSPPPIYFCLNKPVLKMEKLWDVCAPLDCAQNLWIELKKLVFIYLHQFLVLAAAADFNILQARWFNILDLEQNLIDVTFLIIFAISQAYNVINE